MNKNTWERYTKFRMRPILQPLMEVTELKSIVVGAGGGGGGGSGSPHPVWHSDPLYEVLQRNGYNHAEALDRLDQHYGEHRYAGGSGGAGGYQHTGPSRHSGIDWGYLRGPEICVWCGEVYVPSDRGEFCDRCYGNKNGTIA